MNFVSFALLDGATFYIGSQPPQSCVKILPVTNNDIVTIRAHWILNGNVEYSEDLLPGETRSHTLNPPDCDNYTASVQTYRLRLTSDFELVEEGIDLEEFENDQGDETVQTNVEADTGPKIPDSVNDAANNPIDWTTATTEQEAIQQGFTSLIVDQRSTRDVEIGLLNKIATNVAVLQNPEFDQTEIRNAWSGDSINASNSLETLGTTLGSIPTTIGGSAPDTVLAIPIAGTDITVDVNPMNNPTAASIFAWIRKLFKWLITVWLVVVCVRVLREQINTFLNSPQVKIATRTPVVGAAAAMASITAVAGIIATGVILVASLSAFGTYGAELLLQPLMNATGIVGHAVWLLDQVFPLAYAIGCLNAWFIYSLAASAITGGVSLAIRAVAFSLMFGLFAVNTSAGVVHFDNWTGNEVSMGSYLIALCQRRGMGDS